MKKLVIALSIFVFSSLVTTSYAQSSASDNVPVTANLLVGLTITQISGNLDFGNIVVTSSPQNPSKTPDQGAVFQVTGNASTPVTVTYNNVTLSNGATGTMTFTPSVEYTNTSSYSGAASVSSGGSVTLTSGGNSWLWVGGSLAVAANQEAGAYSGTFTISVAY